MTYATLSVGELMTLPDVDNEERPVRRFLIHFLIALALKRAARRLSGR